MTNGKGFSHRPMGKMGAPDIGGQKAKNTKETFKRLAGYFSNHKIKLFGIFLLVVIATIMTTTATRLIGVGIDDYIFFGDLAGLSRLCLIMLGMYLFISLFTWLQGLIMIHIVQGIVAKIREEVFNKLQSLPLRYFDSKPNGDIMSRVVNDVDNISNTLNQCISQILTSVFTVVFTFIAMLMLSPMLTIISVVTIPVMIFLTKTIAKKSKVFFLNRQEKLGNLNGYIEEIISGQKVVKIFNKEENKIEEFKKINDDLLDFGIKAEIYSGALAPIATALNNANYAAIVLIGGVMILTGMPMTVGIISTFVTYSRQFTRPLNEIANLINMAMSALAGAERVFEIIDEEPEPKDNEDAYNLDVVSGKVELENVNFSYVENTPVLKNLSLYANPGQTVALVGPTGAGKTTIINLLTRFYDIENGSIKLDEHDIRKITRNSLRSSLGIVLQDTYLFIGTIEDNIRYGRLDATFDEIKVAAKTANAHEFIKKLPDGYKTILVDGGSNLSQGQRQMISIARAILFDPSILILDEATSSVDTRTEMRIQEAMKNLMKGRTNFVIAHRLSTTRDADLIAVINNGEIIERGTHEELLDKKGFYYNLYTSQFREETA